MIQANKYILLLIILFSFSLYSTSSLQAMDFINQSNSELKVERGSRNNNIEEDVVDNDDSKVIQGKDKKVDNMLEVVSEAEIFYNSGLNFFYNNQYKLAIESFQKSADLNDEIFSNKSLSYLVYLKAMSGEKSLESYWDSLLDENKVNLQYKAVEGWKQYWLKNPNDKSYKEIIQKTLHVLTSQSIKNQVVQKSILSLANSYIQSKQYGLALENLMKLVQQKNNFNSQLWYLMGCIFLDSDEYYNPKRAKIAFQRVLQNKNNSDYYEKALVKMNSFLLRK